MKLKNGSLFNGDTIEVMQELIDVDTKVDYILTSPPYNMRGHEKEYYNNADYFKDNKSNDEYALWIIDLFHHYKDLLKENGVVIFNMNYMSSLKNRAFNLFKIISRIEEETEFTLIDQIAWKKDSAMALTEARLSRIFENVWIFIKKDDWKSFNQKYKKVLAGKWNFIEAPNNDFVNDVNKACFSSSLVESLLHLYDIQEGNVVLDNFMGTGTTAIGAIKCNAKYIGIELDKDTFNFSLERIHSFEGDFTKTYFSKEQNLFSIGEENERK